MVNPSYYRTLYLDIADYKPATWTGQVEPVPSTMQKPEGGGLDQRLAKTTKPKVYDVPRPAVSAWDWCSMTPQSSVAGRSVTAVYGFAAQMQQSQTQGKLSGMVYEGGSGVRPKVPTPVTPCYMGVPAPSEVAEMIEHAQCALKMTHRQNQSIFHGIVGSTMSVCGPGRPPPFSNS